MQVSIIIPSLNSPIIDRILQAIRSQYDIEKVREIIVVGKDHPNLIKADNLVKFIDTGAPVSAPKARNIGIQESKCDVLLFLDSDCLPRPNWLSQHIKAQLQGHPVVGGGVIPKGINYWSLTYNLTFFHEYLTTTTEGARNYLPTLNLSVHRNVIEQVGVMDESLLRGQDIDWTSRMVSRGYALHFCPEAAVFHHHNRTTFKKVWADCKRSGYYMRQVRMEKTNQLAAPMIIKSRLLLLLFSPIIALIVTIKIISKKSFTISKNWPTIFAIYLTKIAWCWGASRLSDSSAK